MMAAEKYRGLMQLASDTTKIGATADERRMDALRVFSLVKNLEAKEGRKEAIFRVHFLLGHTRLSFGHWLPSSGVSTFCYSSTPFAALGLLPSRRLPRNATLLASFGTKAETGVSIYRAYSGYRFCGLNTISSLILAHALRQ